MINDETTEKRTLKLSNTVGAKPIPFTDRGFAALFAIRKHLEEEYHEKSGIDYMVPAPTAIHIALMHYCESKGIEFDVHENPESN